MFIFTIYCLENSCVSVLVIAGAFCGKGLQKQERTNASVTYTSGHSVWFNITSDTASVREISLSIVDMQASTKGCTSLLEREFGAAQGNVKTCIESMLYCCTTVQGRRCTCLFLRNYIVVSSDKGVYIYL